MHTRFQAYAAPSPPTVLAGPVLAIPEPRGWSGVAWATSSVADRRWI